MKNARRHRSVVLTIAGSDSGGGAGVQADLKTIQSLGLHAVTVITAVTAQNPEAVKSVYPIPADVVKAQLEAVFEYFEPRAIKTGMLYSAEIVEAVSDFFASLKKSVPIVIDPVMISTSGTRLLKEEAIDALVRRLFPLSILVTPNMLEAEVLASRKIDSIASMKDAARAINEKFGVNVLVKGGHLKGFVVTDVLYDGERMYLFRGTRINLHKTHGTGCTLSAAIAAYIARGCSLIEAVKMARRYLRRSLRKGYVLGESICLGH